MGSRLEANSNAVRKKIEKHTFDDEEGEEYRASGFGGFTDYFRRKKIKLQNLDAERRQQNADKPQIFRGVVAHINGYTQPSLNDLHSMIVAHGGGFLSYLDGKTMVTHVIASNLTLKKKVEFKRYRVVKPAWVVDSIAAGKLLPWDLYRVLNEGAKQNSLAFDKGNIASQASSQYTGYREQTDKSWYTSQLQDLANRLDRRGIICSNSAPISGQGAVGMLTAANTNSARENADDLEIHNLQEGSSLGEMRQSLIRRLEKERPEQRKDSIDCMPDVPSNPSRQSIPVMGDDNTNTENVTAVSEPYQGESEPSALESPTAPNTVSPGKRKLTAEEHNANLLADPKVWKSTVVNPGFLKQYYEESRLHHLSSWKASLKSQLQALANEKSSSQKARQKGPKGARRYVLHVDFDSFFAAVSLKKHPEWIELPAVVAHGGSTGSEIASCNYPARKFGVKNGMWMKAAQQLCSDLKVLPYDFKAYEEASRGFYKAIVDTGGVVQSVSVDEALVDMSVACIEAGGSDGKAAHEGAIYREQAKADEIAESLRATVKEKTGCAVSVGLGGNILLAKLALRKAKPAGQYQIKPGDVMEFIGALTVQELPGVASSIGKKLEEIGVIYIRDAWELSKEKLVTTLGPKTGEKIWEYARGIDRAEVGDQVVRKSVSAEVNWGVRFATQDQADEFIASLCEELHKRLVTEGVKGHQLTMKIMRRAADAGLDPPKHLGHGKCDTFNKSQILGTSTNNKEIITREALSIMRGFGFPPGELRGLGIQMTKLEPVKTDSLIDSSQKRLQFKKPELSNRLDTTQHGNDILDSPKKPVKVTMHPAAALGDQTPEGDSDSLLNTSGTQFILPTQFDASVLAELPDDIKNNFRKNPSWKQDPRQPALTFKTSPAAPAQQAIAPDIPPESQLDPDTLAALPEDVRAEVLSFYRKPPTPQKQALLPQSPHKIRKVTARAPITPTKKRTANLLSRKGGQKSDPYSTLTQSNFLSRPAASTTAAGDPEIDAEFLAALPEDIRAEVLEQQRQARLQKRGGLSISAKSKARGQAPPPTVQRLLRLPPKPARPTFTANKLSSLPELRDAVGAWVEALDGEKPDDEDVGALVAYLKKVVVIEKDMTKAVAVVKWLLWLMGEMEDDQRQVWETAAAMLVNGVREAVKSRGLGEVEF